MELFFSHKKIMKLWRKHRKEQRPAMALASAWRYNSRPTAASDRPQNHTAQDRTAGQGEEATETHIQKSARRPGLAEETHEVQGREAVSTPTVEHSQRLQKLEVSPCQNRRTSPWTFGSGFRTLGLHPSWVFVHYRSLMPYSEQLQNQHPSLSQRNKGKVFIHTHDVIFFHS